MHQLLLKYYNSKPKLHSSKKSVKVDTDAKVDISEPFSSTRVVMVVVVVVVVGDMPAITKTILAKTRLVCLSSSDIF